MTAAEIGEAMEDAGYARQNLTRLKENLTRSPLTAKAKRGAFRIRTNSLQEIEQKFGTYLQVRPLKPSDSVLPRELFDGTRGYLERVVAQINGSYDGGLYDCCAVMCRRLLETLVIELYEHLGRQAELRGSDGNYLMFSALLAILERDKTISPGRNTSKGLRDCKRLGDQSAHNRRFNARKNDIDRVRDGVRLASEELLHLAGMV
ncbi:MAG: hypothetical protein GY769_16100 [bacterium]|nr:hypothetical protein [bacterium]